MNPTLKAPDMLQVVPYNGGKMRRGDVIAFVPPGDNKKVIHRILSINPQGIRTLGDHNAFVDEWVLSPEDIIGRVVYAQRGERWLNVYGGTAGRIFALSVKILRKVNHLISSPLHLPYRWISKSGIFRGWLTKRMNIHVLTFKRPYGTDLQLLMGNRVIGRYLHEKNRWKIYRPFRLFVDETSLPQGTTEQPSAKGGGKLKYKEPHLVNLGGDADAGACADGSSEKASCSTGNAATGTTCDSGGAAGFCTTDGEGGK